MAKIAGTALFTAVVVLAILTGAFLWRLASGPVSIAFLNGTIREQINRNLGGYSVNLSDAVIERDLRSGMPHVRLRNVELVDAAGAVIARAPRAAIGLDGAALLHASLVPKRIELIGPRILVKRRADGGLELGFGVLDEAQAHGTRGDRADRRNSSQYSGKSDQMPLANAIQPQTTGGTMLEFIFRTLSGNGGSGSTLASLDSVEVTNADIELFDEANAAYWRAPQANLSLKRMPYGFALLSDIKIASEGEPWRAEIAANYHANSRIFSIGARIFDLVPANISNQVFALSKLAQVKIPLSGHVEIELSPAGKISKGSAEFSAAAGLFGFPGYISQPILVDEGSLRLDYDPGTGGVVISNSSILIGPSRTDLSGRIDPVRAASGRLTALKIMVSARDASPSPPSADAVFPIDQVDLDGVASVEEARLDINDLMIRAGKAGVRMRGTFSGGARSAGIRVAGRVRDLPAGVLKKLWPPMIAPNARKWVNDNVEQGNVPDAEFTVTLPPDSLAEALAAKLIPNQAIDLRFTLAGVTTAYVKGLPLIRDGSGEGHLQGDRFDLRLDHGRIDTPSGRSIELKSGTMVATALLAPVTPSEYHVQAAADLSAALEFIALPPLSVVDSSSLAAGKLSGRAAVALDISIPLTRHVMHDEVTVTAGGTIADATFRDVSSGVDLEGGSLALELTMNNIEIKGPVKINGIPAKLTWNRGISAGSAQRAVIEAELDDDARQNIAKDVNDFVHGPVKVKATMANLGSGAMAVGVEADLSKADLRIDSIGWARPPMANTSVSFEYRPSDKGAQIAGIEIKGADLSIEGDIRLAPKGGIAEASLSTVHLSDENQFALRMRRDGDVTNLVVSGTSFDARPLIKSAFGRSGGNAEGMETGSTVSISANLDRIYAHRGEVITGVTGSIAARGGSVTQADIGGTFVSGNPVSFKIAPSGEGREIRIVGKDGGAALRAANFYSKIAGGALDFEAATGGGGDGSIRSGRLIIRDFDVRDEAALAVLDSKGKPKKGGSRRDGMAFGRLTLPFTADSRFVRIKDATVHGAEMCATADGLIRKADGALDISGTIIPACAINRVPGQIPVIGDILIGDGLFGLTYALGGAISAPSFQVNPVSAIAPGIFRRLFEFGTGPAQSLARPHND